ncbi:GIY-YIG nuclease family protein [Tropicimonas marinistellae]|uniref:GIY-YIG nuclease family protein n=1 Tax=Tropicimonas marinistellae TaxID=1739787 RepID=UPI00082EAE61|nr:GIY-YIG nuclease family protein [Tropicimonas marinistellae]
MGRSVRLYLADGTATGILTAEIVNWTGHVLSSPRTRVDVALKRDEVKRTGVYLLYGFETDNDLPSVYVGEGDSIASRLYSHSKDDEKDFWERFVAITSKDLNLTKAHVKYLEGRIITLLKAAKKSSVTNKTDPSFDRLPEADISDMEAFLEELQLVLPVIGVDFLRKPKQGNSQSSDSKQSQTVFTIQNPKKGIDAMAIESEGEFVILAGSVGSLHQAISFGEKRRSFRKQVLESGRAEKVDDKTFRLVDDVAFSSPSAASVFLHGTARNGRTDWLVSGQSKNYADWKDEALGGDQAQ